MNREREKMNDLDEKNESVCVLYIYIDDCNKCAAANAACVFYVHRRSSQYIVVVQLYLFIYSTVAL